MTILSVYINLSQTSNIEEEIRKLRESYRLPSEELYVLVAETKVQRKQQDEEAQFKKFLDNSPGRKDLTFDDYQKLLKLTRFAYVREQNGEPEIHAIKLLEAFGNYEAAIEYLKRYENANPSRPQLIHDACLFALPSDKYNVALWRELNRRHMPDVRYEKTLTLAPKIEHYVSEHQKELEEIAEREVYSDYEKRFGDEWEEAYKIKKETKSFDEYYQKHKEQVEKKITEMVNKQFSHEAHKRITEQPDIFKDLDRSEAFEKFRESEEGKKLWEELTENIRDKQEEALRKQYEKTQSANVAKQEYIANRLKKIKKKVIEGSVKDAKSRILSENTSIETLYHYLSQCSYKNAGQNPKAAALFFGYGVPEEEFDKWLALTPSSTSNIPNVFIDGAEIGYPGFYLKKLSKSDPTCAIAGKMTSCCQWMGGDGGEYAIHAITSPNGDIYGLYQKRGENPGENDILLAQTWTWLSKNNNIVFDTIESQIDFRRKHEQMLLDLFVLLAHKLVTEQGIPKVFLGKGATPEELLQYKVKKSEEPKDEIDNNDSFLYQSLISSPIFLGVYLENHPKSKLHKILKETIEPKAQDLLEWSEMDENKVLLKTAIQEGNLAKVQYLIDNIWPVTKDSLYNFFAILKVAAKYNQEDIIDYLLSKGVKITPYTSGENPLHLTSSISIMKKLIQAQIGLNINTTDDFYCTPLYKAVERGNKEQVDFLIQQGADLVQWKRSLLRAAIGNVEMTKYLIEKGVDRKQITDEDFGSNLLHDARTLQEPTRFTYIQFLVADLKMDVNIPDSNGMTAFLYATENQNLAEMQFLLEHGANIIQADMRGNNALILAIRRNSFEMVKFLLDHGADPKQKAQDGYSTVDMVCMRPLGIDEKIIKILLEKDKMPLPAFDLSRQRDKGDRKEKEDTEVTVIQEQSIQDHPKNM